MSVQDKVNTINQLIKQVPPNKTAFVTLFVNAVEGKYSQRGISGYVSAEDNIEINDDFANETSVAEATGTDRMTISFMVPSKHYAAINVSKAGPTELRGSIVLIDASSTTIPTS